MLMKTKKGGDMGKAKVKKETAVKEEAKKAENSDLLNFWDPEKRQPIVHDYLVPATVDADGKPCAKISFRRVVNKTKDTWGIIVTFGETGKESYIGASANTLGRTYQFKPKAKDNTKSAPAEKL